MNNNVDKLIQVAESIDWVVESFTPASQGHSVTYIDLRLAGRKPVESECRDHKDYELLTKAWAKRGRIASDVYSTFEELLTQEIKRINSIRAELEKDEDE